MDMDLAPQTHLLHRLMGVRTLPNVLYHYTRSAGVTGILSNRRLWATHVRFLNDSSEYHYTISLASEHLRRFARGCTDRRLQRLNDEWLYALEVAKSTQVYVVSFSAARDLLSQWQAYGSGGCALGFDQFHLLSIGSAFEGRVGFVPCIYNPVQQSDVFAYATDYLRGLYLARCGSAEQADQQLVDEFGAHFFGHVTMLCASFKDPAFQQEHEWRLAFEGPRLDASDARLRWRTGKTTRIPYIEVPIGTDDPDLPLFRIDIAPNAPPDAEATLSQVLDAASVTVRDISRSRIPFRDV